MQIPWNPGDPLSPRSCLSHVALPVTDYQSSGLARQVFHLSYLPIQETCETLEDKGTDLIRVLFYSFPFQALPPTRRRMLILTSLA